MHTKSAGNWEVREIKEKMRDELIYSGRRREERRGGDGGGVILGGEIAVRGGDSGRKGANI